MQIRPLIHEDKSQWLSLWRQYLDFYRHPLEDQITELTFERLCHGQEMLGLVAVSPGGELCGFMTLVFHPPTWSIHGYCYVEELLVASQFRGQGIARSLFNEAWRQADARGSSRVYWFTEQNNDRARALYDKLGQLAPYVIYRREPGKTSD